MRNSIERLCLSLSLGNTKVDSDRDRVEQISLLGAAGELLDCDLVLLWQPDASGADLRCRLGWNSLRLNDPELIARISPITLWPVEALPGRVWGTARSQAVREMAGDLHSERSTLLTKAGIRAAGALPISDGMQVAFVLEFLALNCATLDAFPDGVQHLSEFLAQRKRGRASKALSTHKSVDPRENPAIRA